MKPTTDIGDSKPDIACKSIYSHIVQSLLGELHGNLMRLVTENISSDGSPKNFLVLGPGEDVFPFIDNLESVTKMLSGGNLVLVDYNPAICDKIASKGLGEYFEIERTDDIPELDTIRGKAVIQNADIRDGFRMPDNSIDGIDMTVSVHHATQYRSDIESILQDAHRVIRPKGIIHIGEGNVDMKYNEYKLHKLAQYVVCSGEQGVTVIDRRCSDEKPRRPYGEQDGPTMTILPDGNVEMTDLKDISRLQGVLEERGYSSTEEDGLLTLPYIDCDNKADFEGLIVPVTAYYSAIREEMSKNLDRLTYMEVEKGLDEEQGNAEKGIVEFYSDPCLILEGLAKAGFNTEKILYTKQGPFVNILARKD